MIRWADARFAHRFAGGPPPVRPPKHGAAKVRYEWREWGRCVLGSAIAAAVLLVLIFVVGSLEQTRPLWAPPGGWLPRLGIITAIWFAVGPLWVTLFPPREIARRGHYTSPRRCARSRCSSVSSTAASSGVGAVPPRCAGIHHGSSLPCTG
jgi:hypothetical protein